MAQQSQRPVDPTDATTVAVTASVDSDGDFATTVKVIDDGLLQMSRLLRQMTILKLLVHLRL